MLFENAMAVRPGDALLPSVMTSPTPAFYRLDPPELARDIEAGTHLVALARAEKSWDEKWWIKVLGPTGVVYVSIRDLISL